MSQLATSQISSHLATDSVPSSHAESGADRKRKDRNNDRPSGSWLRWSTPIMVGVAFVAGIAATVQVLGLMVAANGANSADEVLRVRAPAAHPSQPTAGAADQDNVMVVVGRRPARPTAGAGLVNKFAS